MIIEEISSTLFFKNTAAWIHKYAIVFTLLCISLIFLCTLKGSKGNKVPAGVGHESMVANAPPFETSMERGRYVQILSLAQHHTFAVDAYKDMLRPDIAWYNGHFYPPFPPGVSLASVPLYLAGKTIGLGQVFATLTTTIMSLATVYLILLIGKVLHLGKRSSAIAAIIYAIGTNAFAYSVSLSAHPFSAFATAALLYAYIQQIKSKHPLYILAAMWALLGLQLFIDYPNIAILAIFPIAATWQQLYRQLKQKRTRYAQKIIAVSLGGLLIALGPYMIFSFAHYGKPFIFTNAYNLKALQHQGISVDEKNLTNNIFTIKKYSDRFVPSRIISGAHTLLISHDRGLFVYSPVLVCLFAGLYILFRREAYLALIILASVVLNVLIYGIFDDPWGGWAFGPRYLIVTAPIAAILAAIAYEHSIKNSRVLKIFFFITLCISVSINLAGALTTNAIPPSIEAAGGNLKDNFMSNLEMLPEGVSSFVYNHFLRSMFTPTDFVFELFIAIGMALFALVWI